jgi:hypothetical protein
MARLIMRVADSILPGRRAARGVPLAELCSVLLLAEADERKATPQPPQNPSAQPGTGVSAEFNTEASGDLTAERFPENVHRERPETRRAVPPLLQSPIARLCLAATVVAAASVSVLGVLALRPTADILSVVDAFPNPGDPGLTRASVPGPDPSTAAGPPLGEPQSVKRSLDPELTERLTLSTSSSAKSPDLTTAARPSAAERSPEIASARATPVLAARPPAAAPVAPDDRAVLKADAPPAVAKLEMPKSASPSSSVSPNAPPPATPPTAVAPTAVIPPPEPQAATAETAALLSRGDALFGVGDVASARLFYERAADAGNGEAALRLGETYDPNFLERVQLRTVQGDAAAAVFWYRRARELGVAEAEILLQGIQAK